MKTYIARFMRVNPQLASYETTRKIEAKTFASALKKARDISKKTIYGSMELLDVKEV